VLRGIAPLLVLWAHLGGWWLSARSVHSPLEAGWTSYVAAPLHLWQDGGYLGVLLFFLVSGFIITHVSMHETVLEFSVKRVFRLLPLFWITLGLIAALTAICPLLHIPPVLGPEPFGPDYLATASLLNWAWGPPRAALSVGWSIFIEVIFYSVVAACIPLSRERPMAGSWLALGIVFLVYMAVVGSGPTPKFLWAWMYLPYLLIGRAFYLGVARRAAPAQTISFGACCAGAFLLMFTSVAPGRLLGEGTEALISQGAACGIFAALCFANVKRAPRSLSYCADVSYSLYLLHVPVGSFALNILAAKGLPYEMALPVTVAMLLTVAGLSFRHVEQPLQQLARSLIAAVPSGRGLALRRSSYIQGRIAAVRLAIWRLLESTAT
jgi:peptidoglycan/LPS O-acetylase OafA/YrhL